MAPTRITNTSKISQTIATTPALPKESIFIAMNILDDDLATLREEVTGLATMLGGVLTPVAPDSDVAGTLIGSPISSAILTRVREQQGIVKSLCNQILDIEARLEL